MGKINKTNQKSTQIKTMKTFLVSVCVFATMVDARRDRSDRDGSDTDRPDIDFSKIRDANLDRVVRDPLETHDNLPFMKFMAPNERNVDNFFMEWVGTYGAANIHTPADADRAKENWKRTNKKVRESFVQSFGNPKAKRLQHNQFSAMSEEELDTLTGKLGTTRSGRSSGGDRWSRDGRNLQADQPAVYWGEDYIGPVKDQG